MKSEQAVLIDVPPDGPTRAERIEAFKKAHNILTLEGCDDWIALIPFREDEGKSIFDCIAQSCRLYDEAGQSATGQTEDGAIITLCEQQKITCPL